MILEKNSFHKNFKLNQTAFSNVDALLAYTKENEVEVHDFLLEWFSESETITVKTSGSTGTPKTILLRKEQVINSAKATGAFFDLAENTTALFCLPIHYIAGKLMLVRALVLGWHLDVVPTKGNPLENVSKTYDFGAMVPLQLSNSISKIHLIRKVIVGGGVVSKELEQQVHNVTSNIYATYGMTETITHIAVRKIPTNSVEVSRIQKSIYKVLPNVQIYKDTRNCLVIKAPKVADEVVFTNDVVDLISDTQFIWKGRFDNIINSGGIKLQSEVIEEKLSKAINSRFFVTGIQDAFLGEKLVLIVEGKQKEIDFSNTYLTKYETPKDIYFTDTFVETSSGKILRRETLDKVLPNQ